MPWFAPRAAASKGGDASSSSSGPTATLDSSPPTISEQEWEEAGRKSGSTGEKIEGSIAPTTLLRLAPPARAAGAEILFSAASAGDVDAVSWSSFVFSSQRDAFEPEKGLENIDFDSSCRSLSLKKTKKLQKKKKTGRRRPRGPRPAPLDRRHDPGQPAARRGEERVHLHGPEAPPSSRSFRRRRGAERENLSSSSSSPVVDGALAPLQQGLFGARPARGRGRSRARAAGAVDAGAEEGAGDARGGRRREERRRRSRRVGRRRRRRRRL